MTALKSGNLQLLLDQPKGESTIVSCYADTSVSEGFEAHWLQPLKAEVARIRQRLVGDPRAAEEFEENLKCIRRALEGAEAKQARGMAIFSSVARDFFVAIPADRPFENRLVIAQEPYVVPLIEAELMRRDYLVVLADTHRAHWYAAWPGASRVLGASDEDVPKKQHSSGENWGKKQTRIERHRRDHILHFQKDLVERLQEEWAKHSYDGIVLLGEHALLEQFRNRMPARLSSKIVHMGPHAWAEDEAAVDEKIQAVLSSALREEHASVAAELEGRLREATAVAAGPQEAIDALRDGQVAVLLFGPDTGASASHCTG
jgi:peptide subunit release factor 1 (eRF1)